jgi:hypothetical protein
MQVAFLLGTEKRPPAGLDGIGAEAGQLAQPKSRLVVVALVVRFPM